jgi:hypothetical protein
LGLFSRTFSMKKTMQKPRRAAKVVDRTSPDDQPSQAEMKKAVRAYQGLQFSCDEIRERIENAEHLSIGGSGVDYPTPKVSWEVASGFGAPCYDPSNTYTVSVDIPDDECYWYIEGETLPELHRELAKGLEKQAEYLKRAALWLEIQAQTQRRMAEVT